MIKNKNSSNNALLIAGFVVIALLLAWQGSKMSVEKTHDLSVSGSGKLDFLPDESQIFFRLETTANNPKNAQDKNSESASKVIAALKSVGVEKDDIETMNYHVEIIREWNPKLEKYEDKGYRASHSLKVTSKNLDLVGKIVETGVSNGVNNVDNVLFTLSKEKEKEAKSAVLSLAAKNAREKADVLAQSLAVKIKGIKSISESSYNVIPYYARSDMVMEMSAAKVAPPIQPSDVNLQAQVNVVFDIR